MASAALIHRHGVQQWLQRHCESSSAVAGGVVVVSGEQPSKPDTVAEWPSDSKLTASLASAAQAAVQRARPVVLAPAVRLAGSNHNRVISLPLRSGERTLGAVALAVRAEDTQTVEQLFRELATASSDIGPVLGPDEESTRSARVARVLAMQTALLAPRTLADGATALVTEMAAATGSVRVTLGIAEPDMRVIAMSNSAEVHRQQALVRNMADAMQEATDQGARVCCPSLPTDPARVVVSHRELQHRTLHSLMTVPLVSSGKAIGALMLEFNTSTPADPALVELAEAVAASVGPLVYLRRRAERPWWQRLLAALRAGRRRLGRRGDPLPKLALLAGIAALAAALFVPLPYRVGAAARIEGSVQRVVAAPFDGFLQRSHVRPGDSVKAGDVLVELADSDLVLEQRKWESTLAQQQNAFEAALARADRAQFVISQGKAAEAQSQLDLVRRQLERTRLTAPIDGVVIKGDLSQTLGAPVQRGESLLTLAPHEDYRLIVEVDERDVADLRPGQRGQLALASLPSERIAIVVERVTPVSAVRDGRNTFDVEARLSTRGVDLRPGLQGVAKIEAGERSFAWIWTHRIVDWARMALWSWVG